MWTFSVPEILLSVGTEDFAVTGDEVCSVEELEFAVRVFEYLATRRCRFRSCGMRMPFDDSTRHDTHFELTCQVAVPIEIYMILRCLGYVCRILGKVAVEMVPVAKSEQLNGIGY
jgi:hypothetical protein